MGGPIRSPDPAWLEWQGWVLDAMEPKEGGEIFPGPRPDRLTIQFPPTIPEGMDRPYFLMGDAEEPVYQWRWTSARPGLTRQRPADSPMFSRWAPTDSPQTLSGRTEDGSCSFAEVWRRPTRRASLSSRSDSRYQ